MEIVKIELDSMDKVKGFIDISSRYVEEMKLSSGRYTVNAKSIMGVYSLELKKTLTLYIESGENLSAILSELTPYM